MSYNYSMNTSHWLEMDAFSDNILSPTELQETIVQIQKNLHYHLVDNIHAEQYYSLDIKLLSNKGNPRLYKLFVDVQVFPFKELLEFITQGPGIEIFAQSLPYVPPKPTPPAPLGFTVLQPITEQFTLAGHVNLISSKIGRDINMNKLNAV